MDNIKDLQQKIDELTTRVEALEKINRPTVKNSSAGATSKVISPSEFLIENKSSGDVSTTFLLCYYAEHLLSMASFNITDIEQQFRTARVTIPQNLNDKVNKNIRKGFITEAAEKKNGKKTWTLTMTGDQAFKDKKY